MRFPPLEAIKDIGNRVILANDYRLEHVNSIVNELFQMAELAS